MKKTMLQVLCVVAALLSYQATNAQTYANDYTSYYSDPSNAITNDAIYRDAANGVYYIAQRDITTQKIMVTMADPNLNPLTSYKYNCLTASFYPTITDIDEVTSLHHLVITGVYAIEGSQQGSFIMSVDKLTGAFLWFRTFPDIDYLRSCVTYNSSTGTAGIIAVGYRNGSGFQYSVTNRSGCIVCVDAAAGAVNWAKDIESPKYVGNSVGVTGVTNWLSDITKIDDNTFVATGVFDEPTAIGSPYDGDGALIEFDANGTMINESALGDPAGLNSSGPRPFLYKEAEAITYDPADNTVVIAGNELLGTYYPTGSTCAEPLDPSGLWVTKINMSTYTTVWSNVYDYYNNPYSVYVYFEPINMHITNDNAGNYAVNFYSEFDQAHGATPYAGNVPIIKLEPTGGNIIYSRDYTSATTQGYLTDICSSVIAGSNNIVGVGSFTSSPSNTGWNIEAFDHINTQCQSYDFPLIMAGTPYSMFALTDQPRAESPGNLFFKQANENLALNVVCSKVQVGPKPGRTTSAAQVANNKTDIDYDATGRLVNISISDGETYKAVLLNSLGQTVQQLNDISGTYTLHLNNLTAGVYYLNLYSEHNKLTKIIPVQ